MPNNDIPGLYQTNFDIIGSLYPLLNCDIYPQVRSPIIAIVYLDFYVYYIILIIQICQVRCSIGLMAHWSSIICS
jgi:hypothetical protein